MEIYSMSSKDKIRSKVLENIASIHSQVKKVVQEESSKRKIKYKKETWKDIKHTSGLYQKGRP